MRTRRFALLLLLPASASACAALLNFEEFDGPSDAEVVEGSAPADVTGEGASDATARGTADGGGDARADVARESSVDREGERDARPGPPTEAGAPDGPDATDGSSPDRDAGDGAEEPLPCPSGFHECADGCASNTSTYSCGASCEPCQIPLNGVSVRCDGIACVASCGNLTLCDAGGVGAGVCTDPTSDPDNCGGCGIVCPSPRTRGTRVCTSMPPTCGISCSGTGLTACPVTSPTDCVDTTSDTRNCGACGMVCAAAGDAAPRCVDGGCR